MKTLKNNSFLSVFTLHLSLLIFLSFLIIPATVNSASLSPVPSDSQKSILLELKIYGGFVSSEFAGHEEGVRILTDGQVISFKKRNYLDKELTSKVADLSPVVLEKINRLINRTVPGELIDDNPERLRVADMPYTDYSLRKNTGELLIFAANREGKNYFIKDYRSRTLTQILNGLRFLDNLPQ